MFLCKTEEKIELIKKYISSSKLAFEIWNTSSFTVMDYFWENHISQG